MKVGGKPPVTLLFGTGAAVSVVFRRDLNCKLGISNGQFFCDGDAPGAAYVKAEVRFDGFVGADLMSKFASVRIDYSQHLIEFEQ